MSCALILFWNMCAGCARRVDVPQPGTQRVCLERLLRQSSPLRTCELALGQSISEVSAILGDEISRRSIESTGAILEVRSEFQTELRFSFRGHEARAGRPGDLLLTRVTITDTSGSAANAIRVRSGWMSAIRKQPRKCTTLSNGIAGQSGGFTSTVFIDTVGFYVALQQLFSSSAKREFLGYSTLVATETPLEDNFPSSNVCALSLADSVRLAKSLPY